MRIFASLKETIRMKRAIIDLGTNTCNLLIAETQGGQYTVLYQGKEGVKLGKDGISRNLLSAAAFTRAETALSRHLEIIRRFEVPQVTTIATSAVRDAANRHEFAAYLYEKTGLELTIVSGEQEAVLIFKGVKLALGYIAGRALILDIGGGSNELIRIAEGEPVWKKSFPLGMARVVEQFPISDPARIEEIAAIEHYFDEGLQALWEQFGDEPAEHLIGCAGAFDTLADLAEQSPAGEKHRIRFRLSLGEFYRIAGQVIGSSLKERAAMTGMDPLRIEMIVPALVLIRLLIKRLGIHSLTWTGYSLREGVLFEQINP